MADKNCDSSFWEVIEEQSSSYDGPCQFIQAHTTLEGDDWVGLDGDPWVTGSEEA